jgi:hypothetical protein
MNLCIAMKNKIKCCLFFIIFLATGCVSKSDNLIINAGAELPPAKNGWTQVTGRWQQRAKDPLPQEGKNYFFPGNAGVAELYQDIDVSNHASLIDIGFYHVNYSAYMRAWHQKPTDEAIEIVEYRNATGNVVDSFKTESCTTTDKWVHITDSRAIPKNTRIIRIRLLSIRHNGSNNDGYHDNLSLTLENRLRLYVIIFIVIVVLIIIAMRTGKKHK